MLDRDLQQKRNDAKKKSTDALRDRLFIADELERYKIVELWEKALKDLDYKHDTEAFTKKFDEIDVLIRKGALESIGKI
jgi:hypothetical protein